MGGPTPEDMAVDLETHLAWLLGRRRWDGRLWFPEAIAACLRARHAEANLDLAAANVNRLDAENRALRAALSRLAAAAFGPPGELLAAADAARALLGE